MLQKRLAAGLDGVRQGRWGQKGQRGKMENRRGREQEGKSSPHGHFQKLASMP